ncbi:MAG: PAS domain S-box protein, partial [Bacteroidetes bacterium]|nr:PAS domain S-box protein [Bacteroidota bacterium]
PYDHKQLLSKIKLLLAWKKNKESDGTQNPIEISIDGENFPVNADRNQILQFLISTYDNVIHKNNELKTTQNDLKSLNEQLETKIKDIALSEEIARINEQRFKIIVQMIPDIIYQIDTKGRFTFINNAVNLLGYLPDELIGKHFRSLLLPEEGDKFSSAAVLKKYIGKVTGNENSPKLFDERRQGNRTTRDLQLHFVPKEKQNTVTGELNGLEDETVIVEVDCTGLYENIGSNKKSNFIGTVGVVRDITKRKHLEKRLQHLASFPQQNVNPILEVDSNGIVTYFNPAAIDILKRLGCDENLNLFLPHDIDDILNVLKEKKEEQLYREIKIKYLIFGENIHLIPDFNVARIYTKDITARKQSEEQVRKLSSAVEQSPSVVLITDTKGIIEYVNPKFCQLTGYAEREVIGQTTKFLKSEQQQSDIFKQLWETITSGNEWRGEFLHRKKSGELYWEFASVSPIRNANAEITHFIKVAEDITSRKFFEDKLRKSERRFAGILDIAEEAIVTVDQSMKIVIFNKGAEDIFGYKATEILGRPLETLIPERFHSKHKDEIEGFSKSNILTKKMGDRQDEILGIRKNGDEFFAEASISQLKEEGEKIFTAVLRDITERKKAEGELIKYKEQLENLVEERTKELRSTYDQLIHSEKLSAAGKLSASIAHEFNNPIFGIRNVLEIIKEKINENKELCDFTNMAINECDRMSTLIEKLRDFHRPSTGKRELLDIHEAIDDTLLLAKIKLKSKNIKIEKDYAIDIPQIKVVSDQIKQVILNLIANAEHAITSPDGGTINLKTEARESGITISVKDDGIGINPMSLS